MDVILHLAIIIATFCDAKTGNEIDNQKCVKQFNQCYIESYDSTWNKKFKANNGRVLAFLNCAQRFGFVNL